LNDNATATIEIYCYLHRPHRPLKQVYLLFKKGSPPERCSGG